jgi:hypothetical protein
MNKDRDKYLTEAMGDCWHIVNYGRCEKCNKVIHRDRDEIDDYSLNLHFSSWDGFGKLWIWANEQRWWYNFWCNSLLWTSKCYRPDFMITDEFRFSFVNPDNFADALYVYLKEYQ